MGRPRRYCSQRCRQRAYRNRTDHAAPAAVPVAAVPVAAVPVAAVPVAAVAVAAAAGAVAAGTVAAGAVAADRVTVRRAWLADVADRVYQLDCAVEDVRTALAENATRAELVTVCRNLVDSAGSLRPALRRLSRL